MKAKILYSFCFIFLYSPFILSSFAQGTGFTYQGRLNSGGAPANGSYDVTFSLFAANTGGVALAGPVTNPAVTVSNGLFTTTVNFGNVFTGTSNWLQIAVSTNGANVFSTLSPRQQLTPTPYAITAANVSGAVSAAQISGTIPNSVLPASPNFSGTVTAANVTGNGANVTNVNAAALNGLTSAGFWKTNGNTGANPTNGAFLGTADNLPLEFKVNTSRALRLEYAFDPVVSNAAPNVIGGYSGNVVSNGYYGSTIAGGGNPLYPNRVGNNYAAVVGGYGNTAKGYGATAMGTVTTANGDASTTMGYGTTANGIYSTAMGLNTSANNNISTAMGAYTIAGGFSSTAMGYYAQANNQGSFVWADSTSTTPFATTANYQFLIRATGGVGINTNNLNGAALAVNGTVTATTFAGNGAGLTNLNAAQLATGIIPLAQLPAAVVTNNATGLSLAGSFTGDGANLTEVDAATLDGLSSAGFWQLGGNNVASGQFIGSVNNQPVEVWVNNQRVMRMADATNVLNGYCPNLLSGHASNSVANGVVGATICGGGSTNNVIQELGYAVGGFPRNGRNLVSKDFGTVAGGFGNLASGVGSTVLGVFNEARGFDSFAMGCYSLSSGRFSTAMGFNTIASGDYSTAMGGSTIASGDYSTAMGFGSRADGKYSVAAGGGAVAGGQSAMAFGASAHASGDYSLAAGYISTASGQASFAMGSGATANGSNSVALGLNSQAANAGTFVWADSQGSSFTSTANNQFLIRANGGVGVGTTTPQAPLNVNGSTRIDAVPFSYGEGLILNLPTDMAGGGYGGINFHNATRGGALTSSTIKWSEAYNYTPDGGGVTGGGLAFIQDNANTRLFLASNGNVGIGTTSPGNLLVVGGSGSPAYCNGTTWVNGSDRNSKQDFAPVSPQEVLAKVSALPITEWQYKIDANGIKHIGPMAQDFYTAFGLNGTDDKHIATVDADGVALAAIQGLNEKLEELKTDLNRKDTENAELKKRLTALEEFVRQQKSN